MIAPWDGPTDPAGVKIRRLGPSLPNTGADTFE